jgi:hypothetical protein
MIFSAVSVSPWSVAEFSMAKGNQQMKLAWKLLAPLARVEVNL